jgi:hypothetical protein
MPATNPNVITSGELPKNDLVDRSAAGIQFQHFQLEQKATGALLGIGRRTVPNPQAQFSMSGSQFGGGHAKSLYGNEDESE